MVPLYDAPEQDSTSGKTKQRDKWALPYLFCLSPNQYSDRGLWQIFPGTTARSPTPAGGAVTPSSTMDILSEEGGGEARVHVEAPYRPAGLLRHAFF